MAEPSGDNNLTPAFLAGVRQQVRTMSTRTRKAFLLALLEQHEHTTDMVVPPTLALFPAQTSAAVLTAISPAPAPAPAALIDFPFPSPAALTIRDGSGDSKQPAPPTPPPESDASPTLANASLAQSTLSPPSIPFFHLPSSPRPRVRLNPTAPESSVTQALPVLCSASPSVQRFASLAATPPVTNKQSFRPRSHSLSGSDHVPPSLSSPQPEPLTREQLPAPAQSELQSQLPTHQRESQISHRRRSSLPASFLLPDAAVPDNTTSPGPRVLLHPPSSQSSQSVVLATSEDIPDLVASPGSTTFKPVYDSGPSSGPSSAPSPGPIPGPVPRTGSSSVSGSSHTSTSTRAYWCISCGHKALRRDDWARHDNVCRFRGREVISMRFPRPYRQQRAWACGFCAAFLGSRDRYHHHVARHFEAGQTPAHWYYVNVIYGLLHQPVIYDAWKRIWAARSAALPLHLRPKASWSLETATAIPLMAAGGDDGRGDDFAGLTLQDALEFFDPARQSGAALAAHADALAIYVAVPNKDATMATIAAVTATASASASASVSGLAVPEALPAAGKEKETGRTQRKTLAIFRSKTATEATPTKTTVIDTTLFELASASSKTSSASSSKKSPPATPEGVTSLSPPPVSTLFVLSAPPRPHAPGNRHHRPGPSSMDQSLPLSSSTAHGMGSLHHQHAISSTEAKAAATAVMLPSRLISTWQQIDEVLEPSSSFCSSTATTVVDEPAMHHPAECR